MLKRLLVLDWDEHYRGYILETGRQLGLRLYLVLSQPNPKLSSLVEGTLVLLNLWPEPMQCVDDIVAYARRHQIDAVFTHEDEMAELAAWVSKRLRLPGPSPESLHRAMDKWATRERLVAAGIPGPACRRVASLEEARAALDELRLPVVIKPLSSAGGYGASKVEHPEGLEAAWEYAFRECLATPKAYQKVIMEEFLPGSLASVEAAVVDGRPTAVAVTDALQVTVPSGPSCSRFVYHGLLVPAMLGDKVCGDIMTMAEAAIRALDIETGIVHTEFKCTSQGGRIVEVNPRLPGVFIPELVHRAWGVNLARAALVLALGQRPDLTVRRRRGACIRLFIAQAEGIIEKITGLDQVAAAPNVVRAVLWVSEGDRIVPPPKDIEARMGYIITEDSGPAEALQAAEHAMAYFSVQVRGTSEPSQ